MHRSEPKRDPESVLAAFNAFLGVMEMPAAFQAFGQFSGHPEGREPLAGARKATPPSGEG